MKPMIILQTDFSQTWGAVASMKGVIKQVDSTLDIQDLCHDIKPFSAWEASLSLNTVVPCWPCGSIFVSVVDPGVGTNRKASVAKLSNGSLVVTPDNGTLTHLKHGIGITEVREIDPELRYSGSESVSVFHGRDIFAYVAALLASGQVDFNRVGKSYDVSHVVDCEEFFIRPTLLPNGIQGFLQTGLKHFGGVTTNILNTQWDSLGFAEGDRVNVCIEHNHQKVFEKHVLYHKSFGFVAVGEPILYKGSSNYLSLDCNQASFMDTFGVGFGKAWIITLSKCNK